MTRPVIQRCVARGVMLLAVVFSGTASAASIDPDIAIESLADAYSKSPVDERVDIRVTIADSSREESIGVQMLPDSNYALELGDITLWTEKDRFLAVHRLNAGAYFSAKRPDGRAQWGVLESLLPPLCVPQLALVHGLEKGFSAPTGFTRNIVWKSCEVDETVSPPVVRLHGEGDGNLVDLVADQHLSRILRFVVRIEARRTKIDMTFTRQPAGLDAPKLGVDLAGRTQVESIAELAPVSGDVRVGMKLPDLVLQSVDTASVNVLSGPCVLVMFRSSAELPAPWVEAAHRHAKSRSYACVAPVVVFTLGEAAKQFKEKLDAWSLALAPDAVRYSLSPATTVDRFAPGSAGVLVVIDGAMTVKAIVALSAEDADTAAARLGEADKN